MEDEWKTKQKKLSKKKNHFKVFYNKTLKQSKRLQFIQKKNMPSK